MKRKGQGRQEARKEVGQKTQRDECTCPQQPGMGAGKGKKILKSRYKATIVGRGGGGGGSRGLCPPEAEENRAYNIFHPENAISGPFNP